MKQLFYLLLVLLFSVCTHAQMKVYTVAGGGISFGDGIPATAANISGTEGIWIDGNCNLYLSDNQKKVRKVNLASNIITTISGNGTLGYTGDGGLVTNAKIATYGLYADVNGNVFTAEGNSNVVRKIDAISGIITTFAGGGVIIGDNGPATNAQMNDVRNIYGDDIGNIFISEVARIRKVNKTGIITTIAGTGTQGFSGDGGAATNASVNYPHGMLFDDRGNFYFADRLNNRIRKIDSKGIITTYAGSSEGYGGDGGPATAAKLSGPISFVIDYTGNMVIGDNQNNYMRKVDARTGIITTIAGVGTAMPGSYAEGAAANVADIHPEFMYLDRAGNIYYSCYGGKIFKLTNYLPGLAGNKNDCGETAVQEVATNSDEVMLYPNPVRDEVKIASPGLFPSAIAQDGLGEEVLLYNTLGQLVLQQKMIKSEAIISVRQLPAGVYYVSLQSGNGVVVRKFVKQ